MPYFGTHRTAYPASPTDEHKLRFYHLLSGITRISVSDLNLTIMNGEEANSTLYHVFLQPYLQVEGNSGYVIACTVDFPCGNIHVSGAGVGGCYYIAIFGGKFYFEKL